MLVFQFTKQALKEFSSFDESIKKILTESLIEMKNKDLFALGSKRVLNLLPATHRLRISNYRMLYKRDSDLVTILKVGHRKDIYQ